MKVPRDFHGLTTRHMSGKLNNACSDEEEHQEMTKAELISRIARAGFEPVERDTVYNRVAAV